MIGWTCSAQQYTERRRMKCPQRLQFDLQRSVQNVKASTIQCYTLLTFAQCISVEIWIAALELVKLVRENSLEETAHNSIIASRVHVGTHTKVNIVRVVICIFEEGKVLWKTKFAN
jgi:hypothetical protein